jgi:hypothetical protein
MKAAKVRDQRVKLLQSNCHVARGNRDNPGSFVARRPMADIPVTRVNSLGSRDGLACFSYPAPS